MNVRIRVVDSLISTERIKKLIILLINVVTPSSRPSSSHSLIMQHPLPMEHDFGEVVFLRPHLPVKRAIERLEAVDNVRLCHLPEIGKRLATVLAAAGRNAWTPIRETPHHRLITAAA